MSSASVPPHTDEFALARLTAVPCRLIKAPRVAESPVCLECRLFKVVDLPGDDGHVDDFLVIGRVLGIHIDDRFIENGRVNTAAMQPIARLGYSEYATVEKAWRMRRPG
jgi:flavin reductase (DIM6/NTAB) family NADH-FMN oxidoreductase RutF